MNGGAPEAVEKPLRVPMRDDLLVWRLLRCGEVQERVLEHRIRLAVLGKEERHDREHAHRLLPVLAGLEHIERPLLVSLKLLEKLLLLILSIDKLGNLRAEGRREKGRPHREAALAP